MPGARHLFHHHLVLRPVERFGERVGIVCEEISAADWSDPRIVVGDTCRERVYAHLQPLVAEACDTCLHLVKTAWELRPARFVVPERLRPAAEMENRKTTPIGKGYQPLRLP